MTNQLPLMNRTKRQDRQQIWRRSATARSSTLRKQGVCSLQMGMEMRGKVRL